MKNENNNKKEYNTKKRSNFTVINNNYFKQKKPTYRETLSRKFNSTNTFTKIFCFIAIFLLFVIYFRTGMSNLNPNYSAEEINFTNFLNLIANIPRPAITIPSAVLPSGLDWGIFNFFLQFLESFYFPILNFQIFLINSLLSLLNYVWFIAGWVLGIG